MIHDGAISHNEKEDVIKGTYSVMIKGRFNVHALFNFMFNMNHHADIPLPILYAPVPFLLGSIRRLKVSERNQQENGHYSLSL
jgi:hypothetical protein